MLPGDELHAPVAPIRDDGLIGRTRLLHTLERALSDGHTVLVFGPIGSGKTAVLHALARRARARAVPCAIAERTASLPDFTRDRIFVPLEMKDAGFFVPQDKRARFATNYHADEQGQLVSGPPPGSHVMEFATQPTMPSGGGGLVSTAEDY